MAPMITLYILGGCVAVAAILFIVMIVLSVARPPKLPTLTIDSAPLQRVIRALTPLPIASPPPKPPAPPPIPVARTAVPAVPRPAPPVVAPVAPVVQLISKPPLARRPISLPRYPTRKSRKLVLFTLGLLVGLVLASAAAIAYPAMLDPLCDDYEWFGGDAALVVREQARNAHAAIGDFVYSLFQ